MGIGIIYKLVHDFAMFVAKEFDGSYVVGDDNREITTMIARSELHVL